MTDRRRRIDIIADEDFIQGIGDITLEDLRGRRQLCDGLDTELSYYRRLLHGRMDLLSFELRRRSGEETRSLIDALPEILAGNESQDTASWTGRAIPVSIPDLPDEGKRAIDRVLRDDFLSRLPDLDTEEVERIQALLADVEGEISDQRRIVYDRYELLQGELTRRYRDGLADIDELLRS